MYGKSLAHIEKIEEIIPIVGADKIEIAKVFDYSIVVKKNEFKVGDLALYIEVDSILPDGFNDEQRNLYNSLKEILKTEKKSDPASEIVKNTASSLEELQKTSLFPYFEFLRGDKFKIKSKKFGKFKVISQGILFKPEDLCITSYKKGQDFTKFFNITELVTDNDEAGITAEKESWLVKKMKRFAWFRKLWKTYNANHSEEWKTDWPNKSDEDNVQKVFSDMKSKIGYRECVITEKLEGQNITVYSYYKKGFFGKETKKIGVCSRTRNLNFKGTGSKFWKTVKENEYDKKVLSIPGEWFIRGEHLGDGIQGNIYKLPKHEIRFFDFYHKVDGKFIKLNFNASVSFSKKYDLPFVPILDQHYHLPETAQEMLVESNEKTVFGNDLTHLREGFVLRVKDDYNISFKVKNPFYSI